MMRYDTTFETAVFGCNRWDMGNGFTRLLLSGDLDAVSVERFQEMTRRLLQSDCQVIEGRVFGRAVTDTLAAGHEQHRRGDAPRHLRRVMEGAAR